MTPRGVVVHVGSPTLPCRVGLVLDPSPGLSRVRVLAVTTVGIPGSHDEEGDLPHWSAARRVPNPDGTFRWLLAWHELAECERVTQ